MKRTVEYIQVLQEPLQVNLSFWGGPTQFWPIERPSQEAFEDLVIELAELTNSIGTCTDQLKISIDALHLIIKYIGESGVIKLSGICQPLVNILSAAEDTLGGARSPLLQQRPILKGGRPTELTMYRTRAVIVAAIDTLVEAGIASNDATKHVEQELKKLGLINPLTDQEYTASELSGLRTKVRDATAAGKVLEHHEALNSEKAAYPRALAALSGDPKVTAWNLLKAAALMSPTTPDARVVNADTA